MLDLFEELKRRNVVRVGAAYLVVAWVLLQVVDTVAPLMALPDWVPGLVLLLMGVGLPIALVFAWAYEITPDGLKKTEEVEAEASVTPETGRKIDRMIIGGLAVVVVLLIADRMLGLSGDVDPVRMSARSASIAVLPFVNLSSDPEQEYFSDGISEELLNVLAQIPDLRVAARTSSFQFKGDNRDIVGIAQELNVGHVLEGSVRKDGTTVRITAQLIDAADGFHLWSETFDRGLESVFAVQDEISAAIVEALRTEMGLVVAPVARNATTTSAEAHEAYLRGRHLVLQRTRTTIEAAIDEFQRAVELDPDYALAHAELSMAWHLLERNQYGDLTATETIERAEPHALRAVALSETLAEAQAARGFLEWQRGAFDSALAAFALALEINPNYADVQVWTSNILTDDLGRYREAMEATRAAATLDPLSIPATANWARSLFERDEVNEAEVLLQKLAPLAPVLPPHIRGESLSRRGRWANGLRLQLDALMIDPSSVRVPFFMAHDFLRLGLFDEVEATYPELDPYLLAGFGDRARGVAWAEAWVGREPENDAARSALGEALAGAGDFERARPILEETWQRAGRNVARFGIFTPWHAAALTAARRIAGDDATELVRASEDHAARYVEAEIRTPDSTLERGLAKWLAGDVEGAFALIGEGVDEGAALVADRQYLDDLISTPRFAAIQERYRARQAAERADFLASVCGDNPWAEVWTPLDGTCASR